jgi:hypothetical protein
MTLKFFAAAIAAACLALPHSAAAADEPTDAGIPTVVLVGGELTTLRYLPIGGNAPYLSVNDIYRPQPSGYSYGHIAGDALGGAIAGAIINYDIQVRAQKQADEQLLPLTEKLGESGLESLLRQAFADALAAQGMDQKALAFTGDDTPDARMLARLPAARKAQRFLLVRSGNLANQMVKVPLAMHDSKRQFRLAIEVDLLEGRLQRHRLALSRDVAVYTDPIAVAEGEDPLSALAADDFAKLEAALGEAVSDALAIALVERKFPKVPKGERVGALSEVGLVEFEAVLLGHSDGRAVLWTRDDTVVSIPAAEVLTGDALVAAREIESARRKPPTNEAADPASEPDAAAGAEAPEDAAR